MNTDYKYTNQVVDFALPPVSHGTGKLSQHLVSKQGAVIVFWSSVCSHCVRYDVYLNEFENRNPGIALLAVAATTIGCMVTFSFSRFLARRWIAAKFSDRIAKADDFFQANTFAATLLIRFLPLGSNFVTNLVAGVSKAGAAAFVGGSALGYIPQSFIFALLGSGITLEPGLRISLSVVLFLISAALGVYLFRRFRRDATAFE